MITEHAIWSIIRGYVPRKQWVSSTDIYAMVERYGNLDEEDRQPQSAKSRSPKWKTLVRNVLADRAKSGKIRRRNHQDDLPN
jgi:hypothetical protein